MLTDLRLLLIASLVGVLCSTLINEDARNERHSLMQKNRRHRKTPEWLRKAYARLDKRQYYARMLMVFSMITLVITTVVMLYLAPIPR